MGGKGPLSFVDHLQCTRCRARHCAREIHNLCDCGSPLTVAYDLQGIDRAVTKQDIGSRQRDMWRYRELLPVEDDSNIVSLKEGYTPIIPLGKIGKEMGLPRTFLKDEGQLPTGTFKARGAALGVSKAKELGIRTIALPTAGNAGGAWATYGARAGMDLYVVMPADAPEMNKKECLAMGAKLYLVRGLISDAGAIVAEACRRYGWFAAATFQEPYRLEGKKTLGLEIAEQFGWDFPDVILYPCGGGVGMIGIWKAFRELSQMGWVGGTGPRMVAVQPEGCAPVVKAFREGRDQCEPWPDARSVADGLRVPKPLADFLILDVIRESDGLALSVTDDDIVKAVMELARKEGVFACPEGAATLAALGHLRRSGWVREDERVLLINTGSALKYPDLVQGSPVVLDRGEGIHLAQKRPGA